MGAILVGLYVSSRARHNTLELATGSGSAATICVSISLEASREPIARSQHTWAKYPSISGGCVRQQTPRRSCSLDVDPPDDPYGRRSWDPQARFPPSDQVLDEDDPPFDLLMHLRPGARRSTPDTSGLVHLDKRRWPTMANEGQRRSPSGFRRQDERSP